MYVDTCGIKPLQIYIAADGRSYGHLVLCNSVTDALTIPFSGSGFDNRQIGTRINLYKLIQIRYKLLTAGCPTWIPHSIVKFSNNIFFGYSSGLFKDENIHCELNTLDEVLSAILYNCTIVLEGGASQ